jgi:hypothetical protein
VAWHHPRPQLRQRSGATLSYGKFAIGITAGDSDSAAAHPSIAIAASGRHLEGDIAWRITCRATSLDGLPLALVEWTMYEVVRIAASSQIADQTFLR